MKIDILTLFPESLRNALSHSIIKIAREQKLIDISLVNIRDFTTDKHKKVDQPLYGGGSGMLIQAEPVLNAVAHLTANSHKKPFIILTTPRGARLDQRMARQLAKLEWIIIICGHYEGIDERVSTILKPYEVSIGDYVLSGGEPAAWVITDALVRLMPDALGNSSSLDEETFNDFLLETDHYTRPEEIRRLSAPKILLSGDHGKIAAYNEKLAIDLTKKRRPDLYRLFRNETYKGRLYERKNRQD